MLTFFFICLILYVLFYIVGSYITKQNLKSCKTVKIVYRPKRRTFIEEQENPASVYGIFKDMFNKVDPKISSTWVSSSEAEIGLQQPFSWGDLPNIENDGVDKQEMHYKNQRFY